MKATGSESMQFVRYELVPTDADENADDKGEGEGDGEGDELEKFGRKSTHNQSVLLQSSRSRHTAYGGTHDKLYDESQLQE